MSSSHPEGTSPPPPHQTEVVSAVPMMSTQTILIASFSVAALFIALFVNIARKKSLKRGSAILLLGPSDAGKTAIMTTIVYNQTLPTHTSLQTNSALLNLSSTKRPIRVVDVPGHPRLRGEFKEYLSEAKGVAFVVDTSTIARNGPAVAEQLHHVLHVLTSLPPTSTPPVLCILAHKSDLLTSPTSASAAATTTSSEARSQLATSRVRTILERELEKRRASQAGGVGVEGLGAEDESTELGGLECRSTGGSGGFRFADWEGGEVTFLGTSVRGEKADEDDEKSGRGGLSSFKDWLEDLS